MPKKYFYLYENTMTDSKNINSPQQAQQAVRNRNSQENTEAKRQLADRRAQVNAKMAIAQQEKKSIDRF